MGMHLERRCPIIVLVSILSFLLLSAAVWAWGCGDAEPVLPPEQVVENGDEDAVDGPVTVNIYFGYIADEREWLLPEERTVSAADPCRAAMEELIKGPSPASDLFPVLPDTVEVLGVDVAGGVCTVDVSMEIITDANQVGVSAGGEMLALSAIANTLTGLDGVNRVRLLVEGTQSGMIEGRFVEDFWGHVGLPEYLDRNEDIIYR